MVKIFLLFVSLFITSHCLFSQNTFKEKPDWPKGNYRIAYYGNIGVNPGIDLGYEFAFLENVKTKDRTRRNREIIKYKTRRLEIVPEFGMFFDLGSQTSVFEKINLQYKKINNHRFSFTGSVGAGYLQNILRNVYTFDDLGISEQGMQLYNYFAPEIKVGIGRIHLRNGKMGGTYLNFSSQFLFNYNTSILPAPAIELGYRFK